MSNDTCHWPFSTPDEYGHVFFFEKNFDYMAVNRWMTDLFPSVTALTVLYVVAIHAGQRFMKHRPALQLRHALFLWNLALSIYSVVAFCRIFGENSRLLQRYGFQYTICKLHSLEHRNMLGFWILTFAASKILELGDTAFIVLRKTPLIFLHWYHHVATLLFVWYSCVNITALGRWFILANLLVHAVMYFYYALKVLRVRVPKGVSMAITSVQLVQMVVGVAITVNAYRVKQSGEHCCVDYQSIFYAWAMYTSYFVLFLNFFVKSYLEAKPRAAVKVD